MITERRVPAIKKLELKKFKFSPNLFKSLQIGKIEIFYDPQNFNQAHTYHMFRNGIILFQFVQCHHLNAHQKNKTNERTCEYPAFVMVVGMVVVVATIEYQHLLTAVHAP